MQKSKGWKLKFGADMQILAYTFYNEWRKLFFHTKNGDYQFYIKKIEQKHKC